MRIIGYSKLFGDEFRSLFLPRQEIVSNLMNMIESAASLDDLHYVVPCDYYDSDYFVYDIICKLYFQHVPGTDEVQLARFKFASYDDTD